MSKLANCPGCEVAIGEYHCPSCAFESCPYCGRRLGYCLKLGCRCKSAPFWPPPLDDRSPWNGTLTDFKKCCDLGWFARPVGDEWVRCRGDEEGALPDMDRLYREAVWDRHKGRFVVPRRAKSKEPQTNQNVMPPKVESQPNVVVPPQTEPHNDQEPYMLCCGRQCLTRPCVICHKKTHILSCDSIAFCEQCALTVVPQAIAHTVILHSLRGPMSDRMETALAQVQENYWNEPSHILQQLKETP